MITPVARHEQRTNAVLGLPDACRSLRVATKVRPAGTRPVIDEPMLRTLTAGTRLLCEVCVALLPVDGVAVLTRAGPDTSALLHATDPVICRLDDLEFVTAEGPCLDAFWSQSPVLEPDLAGVAATARWPGFAAEAAGVGVGAVFAFPLQVGPVAFGVLSMYRRAAGGLHRLDRSAALGLAQAAAAVVLHDVAEHSREHVDSRLMESMFGRVEINRALGVIAEQRHADIAQARELFRSIALAQHRTSRQVADDILTHRLVFLPDPR